MLRIIALALFANEFLHKSITVKCVLIQSFALTVLVLKSAHNARILTQLNLRRVCTSGDTLSYL
jgi:hypothetical protein